MVVINNLLRHLAGTTGFAITDTEGGFNLTDFSGTSRGSNPGMAG